MGKDGDSRGLVSKEYLDRFALHICYELSRTDEPLAQPKDLLRQVYCIVRKASDLCQQRFRHHAPPGACFRRIPAATRRAWSGFQSRQAVSNTFWSAALRGSKFANRTRRATRLPSLRSATLQTPHPHSGRTTASEIGEMLEEMRRLYRQHGGNPQITD